MDNLQLAICITLFIVLIWILFDCIYRVVSRIRSKKHLNLTQSNSRKTTKNEIICSHITPQQMIEYNAADTWRIWGTPMLSKNQSSIPYQNISNYPMKINEHEPILISNIWNKQWCYNRVKCKKYKRQQNVKIVEI